MIDTVDIILGKWRSYADINDIAEKRNARFKYLVELQNTFLVCDFDFIREVVIGLCTQCHGAEYDYSQISITKPIKFTDKIPVICNKHGKFYIQLFDHLLPSENGKYPAWCFECMKELNSQKGTLRKRINGTILISKGEQIHKSKYNYCLIKYVAMQLNVLLICSECLKLGITIIDGMSPGVITQTPLRHLEGRLCRTCASRFVGKLNSSSDEKIFKQVYDKHGDKYICKEVLPAAKATFNRRVRYFCKKCGADRIQKVNNLLNSNGCKYCSIEARSLSFEDFVKRARAVHGDKYDYIDFSRKPSGEKVINYWCRNCEAEKSQAVKNHLSGSICRRCAERGPNLANVEYPMNMYLIKIDIIDDYDEVIDTVCKIGCTKNDIKRRFRGALKPNMSYSVIYTESFNPGNIAYTIEQAVITKFFKHTYSRGIIKLPSGNNELFDIEVMDDILNYVKELSSQLTAR